MEHLIPEHWFVELPTIALLALTAVFFGVLITGADWLVEGASGIAYRFGLPKIVVGATIVSMGTTSPEAAVSVMAAWEGNSGFALGNAVGSIIMDTGLIFGLCALLVPLPADRFILGRQGWLQFGSAVALALTCYLMYWRFGAEAELGRGVGLALLVALAAYMYISVRWARLRGQQENDQPIVKHASLLLLGMIAIGLTLVVFSSHIVIQSVAQLAGRWGVPQVVIAATLVAAGTSLPELFVGLTAIRKGHPELLVGNVIGADILNVLFVVGASAFAAPLPLVDRAPDAPAPLIFLTLQLPTMLIILGLFRIMIVPAVRYGHFARWNGIPLLIVYVAFVVLSATLGR